MAKGLEDGSWDAYPAGTELCLFHALTVDLLALGGWDSCFCGLRLPNLLVLCTFLPFGIVFTVLLGRGLVKRGISCC